MTLCNKLTMQQTSKHIKTMPRAPKVILFSYLLQKHNIKTKTEYKKNAKKPNFGGQNRQSQEITSHLKGMYQYPLGSVLWGTNKIT